MRYLRLLFITIIFSAPILANYAALDTSFNHSGFTFNSTQIPTWTSQQQTCTAIQSDGKILVAGNAIASPATASQVAVVRFNTDGSLDTTFNPSGSTPGTFIYSIPGLTGINTINSTFGIALQSNGSIILTGTTNLNTGGYPGLFILKLLNSGTLDTSFGIGGTTGITTNPGTGTLSNYVVYGNTGSIIYFWGDTAVSYAILPQDDNKIVIAGQIANANATCFRFLSTGALDTTANNGSGFGSANASAAPGYLSIPSPYPNGTVGCLIKALTIDSSGNIYMAGQYNQNGNTSSLYYPVIYQCSAAGVLNNNYGTQLPNASYTGAFISASTSTIQGSFNNIVLQPDGKAIAIGTAKFPSSSSNYYMTIARFTTAGQLDTTFGNEQGYITNTICSTGVGVCLNENAQLLVTGQLASDPSYAVLLRYNNDGTLDTTFAPNGYITFNNLGYSNTTLGLDSTSDGKIHIGATFTASSTNQFGALQLLGSNVLQGNTATVVAYGYNANYFTQFLYVDIYAQVISDATTRAATVSAVNTILQNYQTNYAAQPNFNYVLYLYLIKTELSQAEITLTATYPIYAEQIGQFFTYLNDRCDTLSALQQ